MSRQPKPAPVPRATRPRRPRSARGCALTATLSRRWSAGFTTFEVPFVVALLAVIVAIAAPGMRGFAVLQRVQALSNDLTTDLMLVRSEAPKRSATAQLAPRESGLQSGWTVAPGMSVLGQTWSEPKAVRLPGHVNPVVVVGGGYDAAAEDAVVPGATTMGNAVLVLDAFDGTLLKTFTSLAGASPAASIGRSIPADVALVDTDHDGHADRGGQVYRLDFEGPAGHAPADLTGGTGTGRRCFYPPDVAVTKAFTPLMFGSGDREKPLLGNTQGHFFQIFDRRTAKGAPAVATPLTWADLYAAGTTPRVDGAGCHMPLITGGKVVTAATSIGGFSFFGTNRPAPLGGNTCSFNLGIARSCAMPMFCVASGGSVLVGGGLPPSPVSGIVVIDTGNGTSRQVPFVIGAPNPRNSAIEGSRINPSIDVPRRRTYWYQEVER